MRLLPAAPFAERQQLRKLITRRETFQ
jgi:hypothetical protein